MKRILSILLISSMVLAISCKKSGSDTNSNTGDQISPQQIQQLAKCPLLSVSNTQGKAVNKFEYTLGRIKRIVSTDSTETSVTFTYNPQNQIEKMDVITKNAQDNFAVLYIYDASKKIIKTKTSVQGIEILNNDFVYEGDKITKVNNVFTVFGFTVKGITRVLYNGKNVSQVFTKIEGEPDLLTFEGLVYDNKLQIYPEGYRTMAMGFVGMANNFFAFFGENNPNQVKIYDENGKLEEFTELVYEYNKNNLPSKGTKSVTKNGKKTTGVFTYLYNCN